MKENISYTPEAHQSLETIKNKELPKQNLVSVFHETKSEYLDSILKNGLRLDNEIKNIGKNIATYNQDIDKYRTPEEINRGLSREKIFLHIHF